MIKMNFPRALLLSLTALSLILLSACEREPRLHLHRGQPVEIAIPAIDLELDAYWDYQFEYGITYDWRAEWIYGWDKEDEKLFGPIGYSEPDVFNLRRYFTGQVPNGPHSRVRANLVHGSMFKGDFDWGFWDILVWNDAVSIDGVQSLHFDEESTLDYVTAYTSQTPYPSRYNAPSFLRSFYEPEPLFAAYETALDINKNLDGFEYDPVRNVYVKHLKMTLLPITYIYLTQVILHHNRGKVSGVSGDANLSGMARSVVLNSGITGSDPITVYYSTRFKKGLPMKSESVDVAGGRLMTFGMCNINPNRISRGYTVDDKNRHYMDVKMLFNNGMDSSFVFDVTDQVRRLYKGGVITVELDMDTIPIPSTKGGSAFDAVVEDYKDGGTHEFEM